MPSTLNALLKQEAIMIVWKHAMRTWRIAAILGMLAVCGCAGHPASAPRESASSVSSTNLAPGSGTDVPLVMVGTWHARERQMLWELGRDGHWKWWNLNEQSGRPSEPPMLEGCWFVRKGIIFFLIEKTKEPPERLGPGLAVTFGVNSVTSDAMVLREVRDNQDTKFHRIPEPGGPANRSLPVAH